MTTTITLPARPPEPATADSPTCTMDLMMQIIVAFLTPMFLACSAGNINHARLAAVQTINAYRARTHADLFSIAQIVGFGLAALGSLSLSMADDISLSMTLRLRGNAVALDRAAEQNRRALRKSLAEAPRHNPAVTEHDVPATGQPDEAGLTVDMPKQPDIAADLQPPISDAPTESAPAPRSPAQHPDQAAPAPMPAIRAAAITPATPPADDQHDQLDQPLSQLTPDQHSQLAWATAMADEAALLMASIADLPPDKRETATRQAAALTRTANTIRAAVSGTGPEPSTAHRLPDQDPSPLHL